MHNKEEIRSEAIRRLEEAELFAVMTFDQDTGEATLNSSAGPIEMIAGGSYMIRQALNHNITSDFVRDLIYSELNQIKKEIEDGSEN